MNGHRARQIRRIAWDAATEAGARTGDRRFVTAPILTTIARRIRRQYTRTGAFPAVIERRPNADALHPPWSRS